MIEGKLIWNGKSLQVQYLSKKGKDTVVNPKQEAFSAAIIQKQGNPKQLHEQTVEIELGPNGQPSSIVLKGEDEVQPDEIQLNPGDFHNPYNFVPALDRSKVTGELGDRCPDGHHVYRSDRWSGSIAVKVTTITPLLIPDAERSTTGQDPSHKILPLRMVDGKPYLALTSLKGMLRSAYEAVTNSRLSVFEGHEERLFYRMNAGDGLSLVPVRIEDGQARLMMGTTSRFPALQQNGRWNISGNMYAAWLPRYDRNTGAIANLAVKYPDRTLPQHGQQVSVWLEEYQKTRNGNPTFKYWRVVKIVPHGIAIGAAPNPGRIRGSHEPTGTEMIQVGGYVCITNANAQNKHDERVFFYGSEATGQLVPIKSSVKADWKQLIQNYGEIHQDDQPDCATQWSRHILNAAGESKLEDGTLCYAYVEQQNNRTVIRQLYPVMIARKLFPESPSHLLSTSLKSAEVMEKLSPADRVFGWVSQDGTGKDSAYKGQLRVHEVNCTTPAAKASQIFQTPLPLAILGAPKPQQSRFYLAKDQKGTALTDGTAKVDGYTHDKTPALRGRKVYPHHRGLPNGYWDNPLDDRTQQAQEDRYQEYRRPKKMNDRRQLQEQQDSQNRSITGWVNPGTEFTFKIDVVNLSDVELGALLYLLKLPIDQFHRLGGGKPLGFGSVRLSVDENTSDLRTGLQWCDFYASLQAKSRDLIDWNCPIESFKQSIELSYGTFKRVSFITAFEKSTKGYEGPVHYPRVTERPDPEGKSYEWFVTNEGQPRSKRLSLPNLGGPALPMKPMNEQAAQREYR